MGGACAVLTVAYSLQFSYGVFLPEMAAALGWDRASLSAPYALYVVVYTGLSFFAGGLTDRFGPRVVVAVGAVAIAGGYALVGTVQAEWQLYVYLCGLAAVGASVAFVPCNVTVIRWFVRRRGLALGLASSGISLAAIIGPLLAAALIDAFGWRSALYALGLGGGAVMLVASGALHRHPEARGLAPDGDAPAGPGPLAALTGSTLAEARRSPAFRLLFAALVLTWLVVFFPFVHLGAHALDLGFGRGEAAAILSCIGFGGLAGRILTGGITDRAGRIPGLVLALLLQVLAFFGLAVSEHLLTLAASAVAFGFAYSGVSVAFPALLGDFFGRAHSGAIAGFVFALAGMAAAAGPYFAGVLHDATGEYVTAFVVAGVVNCLALVFVAFLPEPTVEAGSRRRPAVGQPRPLYGATPGSGSHTPSGGGPVCQNTSIGIPPRGYQ